MGARASSAGLASAITGIGYSLRQLNRVDEATKVLDSAIELLHENNYPYVVDTMRTKAIWLSESKHWEEALATYLEIVRLNEIDGDDHFVAKDLFNAAHCLEELERWEEVIPLALQAREIFKRKKMVFESSWCDLNIASAHAHLGDGLRAIEWGQRAHDIGTLRKDQEMICKSNYVMALGHMALEHFGDAESKLMAAQDIVAGSGDWEQITKIEKALIQVYRAVGRHDDANETERRLGTLQEIVE